VTENRCRRVYYYTRPRCRGDGGAVTELCRSCFRRDGKSVLL
jgi:hypothetical protein